MLLNSNSVTGELLEVRYHGPPPSLFSFHQGPDVVALLSFGESAGGSM